MEGGVRGTERVQAHSGHLRMPAVRVDHIHPAGNTRPAPLCQGAEVLLRFLLISEKPNGDNQQDQP